MKAGFVTALGTPLDKDGNLMVESYKKEIEAQIQAGAAGLLVMGSMGQQPYIRQDVCAKVAEVAVEAVAERLHDLVDLRNKFHDPDISLACLRCHKALIDRTDIFLPDCSLFHAFRISCRIRAGHAPGILCERQTGSADTSRRRRNGAGCGRTAVADIAGSVETRHSCRKCMIHFQSGKFSDQARNADIAELLGEGIEEQPVPEIIRIRTVKIGIASQHGCQVRHQRIF